MNARSGWPALCFTACLLAPASGSDPVCATPREPASRELDWSDGRYRMCAPLADENGRPLPPDYRMMCTVYIDAVPVASARLRPGQLMTGPHGRTGIGIATGLCDSVDGRTSEPAHPLYVKLSPE